MSDTFKQILADTAAAEQASAEPVAVEAAPVAETPAEPVAEVAAPEAEAAPAAETVAPATEAKTPWVSMARHNTVLREAKAAQAQAAELEAKYQAAEQRAQAAEQRVIAGLAQANPELARQTAKTAESDKDWIQQMIDAGAELPPEMVDNLRRMEARQKELDEKLAGVTSHFEQQKEAQAMSDFEQGLNRLQERCPQFTQEEVLGLLQDGVKPSRIVGWHDQVHGARPTAATAAPAARAAAPARVPKIEGAATARASSAPSDDSRESYLAWMREQTQH